MAADRFIVDTDNDGSWVDKPRPTYGPDRKHLTAEDIRDGADPEWRKEHGLAPLGERPYPPGPDADV